MEVRRWDGWRDGTGGEIPVEHRQAVAGFSWSRALRDWGGKPSWVHLSHYNLGRAGSARSSPTNLLISCQWADKAGQARTFGGRFLNLRGAASTKPPEVGSQYRELSRCRQGPSVNIQPSHEPPKTQSDTKIAKRNPLLQKEDGTDPPPIP